MNQFKISFSSTSLSDSKQARKEYRGLISSLLLNKYYILYNSLIQITELLVFDNCFLNLNSKSNANSTKFLFARTLLLSRYTETILKPNSYIFLTSKKNYNV